MVEDFRLGPCDLLNEVPHRIDSRGVKFARWKAFYIGRHSADLCDDCAREWRRVQTEHGGTTTMRRRSQTVLRKTRTA